MFVHSRLKTQGAVSLVAMMTSLAAASALGACTDPVNNTDLRPAGDPEVLAVLVMDDTDQNLLEHATFCKTGDNKRPGIVGLPDASTHQICDDDLSKPAGVSGFDPQGNPTFTPGTVDDAIPTFWYTRIMFDELLDPTVEELLPICICNTFDPSFPTCTDKTLGPITADCTEPGTIEGGTFNGSLLNTQPVTMTCGGNVVAYDGFYNPSGNAFTWPLGPSLFVAPVDLSSIATGSDCTIEIKDAVLDKDGHKVPADQRGTGGTYKWKVADLAFAGSAPAPADPGMEEEITADAPLVLTFNAFIDATSLVPAEVTILEVADCTKTTGVAKTAVIDQDPDGVSIDISIAGAPAGEAWNEVKAYIVTFSDTNVVTDLAGGPGALPGAADFTLCFTTVAP